MVIPLIIGAIINSTCPQVLAVGSFTTALFRDGSFALIGAFLVCMGAGMDFRVAPRALKKGLVVTLTKYAIAVAIGLSIAKYFGPQGVFGLSALAIMAAMDNSNGGLYAALTGEFGDESDVGALAVLSLNDGPFFTMLTFGLAGLANIPFLALVSVAIPITLGMILGNLDREMKDFLNRGGPLLIPFFAFALGSRINFMDIVHAGLGGVVLGLMTVFIGGPIMILMDRRTGGTGICGAAASSTAGNAIATPAAIALIDPSYNSVMAVATSQVAASCITAVIFTPILTSYIAKRNARKASAPAVLLNPE
jgi:2-keto-3-deoxygluconate permease